MEDAREYRGNAEAAVRLAAKSQDEQYKATMLKIAQGWLELAQRLEKKQKRKSPPRK